MEAGSLRLLFHQLVHKTQSLIEVPLCIRLPCCLLHKMHNTNADFTQYVISFVGPFLEATRGQERLHPHL